MNRERVDVSETRRRGDATTRRGMSASEAIMAGKRLSSSGDTAAPTATPRMVRAKIASCPIPWRRTPARAATRQAARGPKRKGKGRSRARKTVTPPLPVRPLTHDIL